MNEPTVLDLLKEKLRLNRLWSKNTPPDESKKEDRQIDQGSRRKIDFPWRSIITVGMALIAQQSLEPPNRKVTLAISLYVISAGFLVLAILAKEWVMPVLSGDSDEPIPSQIKRNPFLIGLPLLLLAFLLFGGNRLFVWILVIVFMVWATWIPKKKRSIFSFKRTIKKLRNWTLSIKISLWILLVFVVVLVVIFFRFYQLNQVPGEMFSDHAEKLLDVSDVLHGQYSIFFPRNTGREAIQFYFTALISTLFGTGLTFISLKIGTVLIGLLTLPFIYLLGKELGNRWIGLLALFLTGIAYWPNVISRVGLRFPLYPLFAAPVLYYLIRGMRHSNRNDLVLSGLFLGLGLHGYSSFRIVPFVVVAAYLIFILHVQSQEKKRSMFWGTLLIAFISLVIFLPLLRYMLENPGMFNYRVLSRITGSETPLPGNPIALFFSNLCRAWTMFFYNNGGIWVHSVVGRPALDVITAVFYFIGSIIIFLRYLQKRHWVDLFLLVSVPLLMMPSILSLAFPIENPSLNRTGGAIIPVFILAAIGLITAIQSLWKGMRTWMGKTAVTLFTAGVLIVTMADNYKLVFQDYKTQFLQNALNTSDIGKVIRGFVDTIGTEDTAYVVPYPYWVDTRLVGINAGFPTKDYALSSQAFSDTVLINRPKLFILNPQDQVDLDLLQTLYPKGILYTYKDELPGKDFYMLMVPAN
jgi:Dolichyl-phosphate-mannose-protein mannosyltransferase